MSKRLKNRLGYKDNSPYKNEPYIVIDGSDITMDGVSKDLILIPDNGKPVLARGGSGTYRFPKARKVLEVPAYELGGEKKPVSPFMDLKPFIEKYKMQYGGVIDYMQTLPEDQQYMFANEFDSFDKATQKEIVEFLKGGYYQEGGAIPVQPEVGRGVAELEDKETILSNGKLTQVKGKTHAEGGVEVNIPGGSRIYSHYLKPEKSLVEQILGRKTKKKMSYADVSKKFPTKPYLDVLSDPDADEYEINTAKIKLANNMAKLDTLFYAQEKSKEMKDQGIFKKGGKYQMAGTFWDEYPTGDPVYPARTPETEYGKGLYSVPFTRTPTTSVNVAPTPLTFYRPVVEEDESPKFNIPTDLQLVVPQKNEVPIIPNRQIQFRNSKSKPRAKSVGVANNAAPVVEDDLQVVPLPFDPLPMRSIQSVSSIGQPTISPQEEVAEQIITSNDDLSYPGTERKKWNWGKFGINPKLAGTVADIGLALSDKLRVSEPTLYDRRKYPLFTRFVDFDDKEVQRMFDKNIQQIQNNGQPEQVKQAQIIDLLSQYKDYQAKVDFGNLQRYEDKRERDTNKLQQYMDTNVDQRVADLDNYRQRKARVDELRAAFKAQRKGRVVEALRGFADYAEKVGYANEFNPNYKVNILTGRVDYKPQQKSDLTNNLLQKYQQNAQNKVSLGNGLTGVIVGNKMIVSNPDGSKFEAVNIE